MHAVKTGMPTRDTIVAVLKKTLRKDALLMAADIPADRECLLK
jgi:hypothetical protein